MLKTLFKIVLVVAGSLMIGWLTTNVTRAVTFYNMETMSSPIGDKGVMIVFLVIGTIIVSSIVRITK